MDGLQWIGKDGSAIGNGRLAMDWMGRLGNRQWTSCDGLDGTARQWTGWQWMAIDGSDWDGWMAWTDRTIRRLMIRLTMERLSNGGLGVALGWARQLMVRGGLDGS